MTDLQNIADIQRKSVTDQLNSDFCQRNDLLYHRYAVASRYVVLLMLNYHFSDLRLNS